MALTSSRSRDFQRGVLRDHVAEVLQDVNAQEHEDSSVSFRLHEVYNELFGLRAA